MNVNELMIGDLLKWKEQPGFNDEDKNMILRVKNIFDDAIKINGRFELYHISLFKPIPLTPEILEKNGFVGNGYAHLFIDNTTHLQYYYHEHRLRNYYYGIDEWDNHREVKDITFQCHCYYVHELQHALKLFGIEKTIEL